MKLKSLLCMINYNKIIYFNIIRQFLLSMCLFYFINLIEFFNHLLSFDNFRIVLFYKKWKMKKIT